MSRCASGIALAVGLALSTGAVGQVTFVETFTSGNEGGWTFGADSFIDPDGGNPGAFLHVTQLDTFAPSPGTTEESIFTGDYRAQQVTALGVDLITFDVDFSAAERPLSPILISDNGTPFNFADDWGAYTLGDAFVPVVGDPWTSFDFEIPAQELSLPADWQFIQFGPEAPAPDWNALITDVSRIEFFYGDPTMFFIFQMWDLGLDNPRITYVPEPATGLLLGLAALLLRRRR